MFRNGCSAPIQFTNECSPLSYADLAECGLIQELERIWFRPEKRAGTAEGELILSGAQSPAKPNSCANEA